MGDMQASRGLAASQDPAPPFTWKWPAGHSSEEFWLNSEVWAPRPPRSQALCDTCLLPTQWLWPLRMGVKGDGPRRASEGEPTGAGLALRGSPNRVLRSPPSLQGSLPFPPRPSRVGAAAAGGCLDKLAPSQPAAVSARAGLWASGHLERCSLQELAR